MKKIAFNKIREEYFQRNVIITTHDGKKITGILGPEISNTGVVYVSDERVLIKDIESIELVKDNQFYKYVLVVYEDDDYEREYSYKTTLNNIKVGDLVLVDRQGSEVTAEVIAIDLFTRETAPYPVEKTKDIISIISSSNDKDDDYVDKRTTVNSDDYKYTYNEIEQKVVDRLTEIGLNYKKCLRVILMLRTHYNSDKQCEKMLSFLETFNEYTVRKLEEIEKYARTLADEENWGRHKVQCPACGNAYMSLIDCLMCSDEEDWNEDKNDESQGKDPYEIDFEMNDVCKKCEWHNPVIEDKAYKNNEPIVFTGLSEEQIRNMDYEDIIAFTIAEGGAMGNPGNVEIISYANERLIGYETNPSYGGLPLYKLYKAIPWLERLAVGLGYVDNIGEGWNHIYTGYGNHLFVRDFIFDGLKDKIEGKKPSDIYVSWKKLVADISKTSRFVKKVARTKSRKLDESIFEFIDRNITPEETLPEDFKLDSFKNYEDGDIIYADGMVDYCLDSEKDNDVLEQLKNLVKLMDEDTIPSITKIIDEYYKENKDKTILGTIDEFLKWIRENSEEYSAELVYKLGANAMLCGKQVETVKIGIALLGLFNLNEEDKITEAIKKLALSDEFTLYCDVTLSNLKKLNDFRFEIAKKSHSYGKIIVVPKLKVTSKEIEDWLFRYGCENEASNGWIAIDIAQKIDLPKYIKENKLSDEDIDGLYNIIDGLINDGPKDGISIYKHKEELFKEILNISKDFIKNIQYLEMICIIQDYLKDEDSKSKFIEKISEILNNKDVKKTIETNIVNGKHLNNVIYISKHVKDIDIYEKVYTIFKENLKNGDEIHAVDLLDYLIIKKENLHDILDLLRSDLSFRDNLGDPEPIISFDDYVLVDIISMLRDFPLEGVDFITQGLLCKTMHARNAAISAIKEWVKSQDKPAKEFLPLDLYATLLELKNKEVIKDYRNDINEIIGVKEDLSKFKEPKVLMQSTNKKSKDEINIFNGNVDMLFSPLIVSRGKEYYQDRMIFNCVKNGDTYIGYVQGSNPKDEYKVSIKLDENDNIKSMSCTCPYESNCKHEYATILYIRNND